MTAEAGPHMAPVQPNGSEWPVPPVDGYTVDDYFRLDLPPHTELIDGSLVFVSPQRDFHGLVVEVLLSGLRRTAPEHLRVRREMAVVLDPRNAPEPDLVVLDAGAVGDRTQSRFEVRDVHLAVEVVSPESEARDRDTKPHKYAKAGIPHFWRVEMAGNDHHAVVYTYQLEPISRTYLSTGLHRGQLKVDEPYEIAIDLSEIDHL